jgi:hypothetical protein
VVRKKLGLTLESEKTDGERVYPHGQKIQTAGKRGQLCHLGAASPRVVHYVFWRDQWCQGRLRRRGGTGILGFKPPSPSHQPAPDLFKVTAATKATSREAQVIAPKITAESIGRPPAPRHLLPRDLPGALARLDDSEIDSLLAAVIEEAKRRNRLSSSPMAMSQDTDLHPRESQSKTAPMYVPAYPRRTRADDDPASLTQGQVNAVRAAFKAGVKPFTIARQFGISRSDVSKALASEARKRKL